MPPPILAGVMFALLAAIYLLFYRRRADSAEVSKGKPKKR